MLRLKKCFSGSKSRGFSLCAKQDAPQHSSNKFGSALIVIYLGRDSAKLKQVWLCTHGLRDSDM